MEGEANGLILIVDDDDSIRETLELALQHYDYPTAVAGDGKEALEWLRQHPSPALILLDLMMPIMDGWQVIEQLQKDERLSRVPLTVITAFGRDLGIAARFPALRKPIELKNLLGHIGTYCGARA